MPLADLSTLDFDYYRTYANKMRTCHENEFLKFIDPELLRYYYRGFNKKETERHVLNKEDMNKREHFLAYSRIFQTTNTVLSNLMYQQPRVMALPAKAATTEDAALMTALQNHYNKELMQKRENQEAVLNGWFYGLGWKKQGYRVSFISKSQDPESVPTRQPGFFEGIKNFFTGNPGAKPDSNESRETAEIVDWEGPFNSSESPLNVMVDHNASIHNRKAVLHRMKRTLYDLKNFGNYDPQTLEDIFEKMEHQGGSRLDDREIELDLNELHIKQRNGLWILSWVDQHDKPLRYDKSTVEGTGDGFEPLILTNEPGVRYPTSHLKIACQQQQHIDYLATLYIRIIDRVRNQLMMNEGVLSPGQKAAVEANKLGGIIWTNRPFSQADYAQLTNSPVSTDIPQLMSMLQQNITEIFGQDEQTIAGKSVNKTLGQDQIANLGTQIRQSGMQDKVRDWLIAQSRTQGKLLKQYSNAEINLQITGRDYIDRETGTKVEDKWVSFMTPENPLGAKHYLTGEYDYDINIYEAMKPDKEGMRNQYLSLFQVTSNPVAQDTMLRNNKIIRNDLVLEEVMKNFDGIENPERFLEELDPTQVGAIKAEQFLMAKGSMPQAEAPAPSKEKASV